MLPIDAKDHDALIDALLPAVREAGRLEMAHFTKGVKFEQKADRSPVTVADHEAEAVLLAALAAIAPDIPVVAEERIAAGGACEYARQFFLVDALDGTRLFIRGKPEFSINIALVEDGKARFGLIFLPPSERLFVTRADGAAYGLEATSEGIDVGGVEKRDARIGGGVQDRDTRRLVALIAERHRSEAEPRHLEAGTAETNMFQMTNTIWLKYDRCWSPE